MYTQYVCSFLVLSCSAMDTASDYESEKKFNFFFENMRTDFGEDETRLQNLKVVKVFHTINDSKNQPGGWFERINYI